MSLVACFLYGFGITTVLGEVDLSTRLNIGIVALSLAALVLLLALLDAIESR